MSRGLSSIEWEWNDDLGTKKIDVMATVEKERKTVSP